MQRRTMLDGALYHLFSHHIIYFIVISLLLSYSEAQRNVFKLDN